jgi:pyruvate/2-oxoglutarate dehydrogenase complex dihydrolipoamide acyltransferase (E2) component
MRTYQADVYFHTEYDGVLANILVSSGVEITYGTPIMITVDDLEHVAAFANYTVDAISNATPVVPPPRAAAAAVVTPVASPPPLPVAASAPIATQSSGGLE